MTPDDPSRAGSLDVVEASPAQSGALQHPTRTRLLYALGGDGATISQLAHRLSLNKGSVAHHLRVLHAVGLVRRGHTRTVRGGTEQYWVAAARRLRTPGGRRGHTHAMLAAVADEIDAGRGTPLVHLRHVRLPAREALRLATHLDETVAGLPDGPDDGSRFGVLVAVYEASGATS